RYRPPAIADLHRAISTADRNHNVLCASWWRIAVVGKIDRTVIAAVATAIAAPARGKTIFINDIFESEGRRRNRRPARRIDMHERFHDAGGYHHQYLGWGIRNYLGLHV